MTRPPKRLQDTIGLQRITPNKARALLIHGLLPPDEAEGFRPTNLSASAIMSMLRRANEVRNRTVTPDTVTKYARDMRNNDWLWTGEPIQIDHDGYIRNGQHRLLAIIESGVTLDLIVISDVDPKAQLVMDVGRPRGTGAQMQLLGVKSAHHITAMANLLLRWRAGRMMNTFQASVIEVDRLIKTEDTLVAALSMTHRVRNVIRKAPQSVLGAAFVEAGHVDVDARDVFFDLLATGADLGARNPILVLRNRIQGQVSRQVRFQRAGQLWQVIYAWNAWRQGREDVQMIRVPSNLTSDTYPTMK